MTKQSWRAGKSTGQKIKSRREQLGLTQTELAKKLGVTQQRVRELEDISRRPSAEMILKVADILNASFLYFLTDCELDDFNEEILLVRYRKLSAGDKRLILDFANLLLTSADIG